ncbi:hypothetical protein Tco_0271259 [Tanacetum coccineum]
MDPSHSSALSSVSQNSHVVSLNALTDEIVAYEKEIDDTHAVKKAKFVVRRSCQKRMLNGDVKQKYLVCNRMGCRKGIHVDTLVLEWQLTYYGQAYIVKAASCGIIGASRAHHLLTGDSDAQMLIHKMENRKKYVSDFSFDYLVENADLLLFFGRCKYKIGALFPFTPLTNLRKCVTVAAGLLKNETTKSYIWLLKAFGKAPSIVVTDKMEMRNAIELTVGGFVQKNLDEPDFKEKLNKIVGILYIGPEAVCFAERRRWRWTKNLIPAGLRNKRNRYGEKNVVVENYANEATSIVDHCVHLLSKDEPRLGAFVEKLKSLKKEVEADCPNPPSKNKTDNLEKLVGVQRTEVVMFTNLLLDLPKDEIKVEYQRRKKRKAIEKSLEGQRYLISSLLYHILFPWSSVGKFRVPFPVAFSPLLFYPMCIIKKTPICVVFLCPPFRP